MKLSIIHSILALVLVIGHLPPAVAEQVIAEPASTTTSDPNRPGAKWFIHDQKKCDAALAELPNALIPVRKIAVAGFTVGPMACLEQSLLDQCKSISANQTVDNVDYEDFDGGFNGGAILRCKLDDDGRETELRGFNSLNNGFIITHVSYDARLGTATDYGFFPTDPILQSLIARYGNPTLAGCCLPGYAQDFRNFKDAIAPYKQVVWASGAVEHFATKHENRLKISLKINLSRAFYDRIFDQFSKRKEAQTQEAARQVVAPKF